jgi:hypothetical protein
MTTALTIALLLFVGGGATRNAEIARREAFATRVRTVIESGDVEAFIRLLSREGLVCNDGVIPTAEVASQLRDKRESFYALLFDTHALEKYVRSIRPVMSYREFFLRAKDAKSTVHLEWNIVQWDSKALGDVAERPYLGLDNERGELRVGLIGEGCH